MMERKMHHMRVFILALLALLAVLAGPAPGIAGDAAPAAAVQSVQGESAPRVPQTNAEIRQWYNDQVAVIPALDQQWQRQGLSAEERARKAHELRHQARLKARDFMPDPREVADLQARDREKYGNPDGPTFEQLVAKNREQGLTGDEVYEKIIGSANRTDRAYNEKFGLPPAGQRP
jgi:hypothetical protein